MTGVSASGFSLPLARPLRTAHGELRVRRGFLVRAVDQEGRVGLGEAAPLPPWTEDLKTCGNALEDAAEQLARPVGEAQEALAKAEIHCRALAKAPAARHGLALALLDLAAQQAREPLCTLLAREHLGKAVRPGEVPVNALLAAEEPGEAAGLARRARAAGYRAVKLKLAGSAAQDAALALATREAAGPEMELRLDANGAWTADEAPARLRALAPARPAYVEQPVPGHDLEALKALRAQRIVPIAADESAASVEAALKVLGVGAADVLVVKPMALGGPDKAAEVLAEAQRRGVPGIVTGLLDGVVARQGALHVAALLPEPRPACGLGSLALLGRGEDDVVQGRLVVPDAPGLGLQGR